MDLAHHHLAGSMQASDAAEAARPLNSPASEHARVLTAGVDLAIG